MRLRLEHGQLCRANGLYPFWSAHPQIYDQSNVCKRKAYFLDFERPKYNIKLELSKKKSLRHKNAVSKRVILTCLFATSPTCLVPSSAKATTDGVVLWPRWMCKYKVLILARQTNAPLLLSRAYLQSFQWLWGFPIPSLLHRSLLCPDQYR